jgi:ABC-type dipeptide/oligopeptide/nickel transport system permease subunit
MSNTGHIGHWLAAGFLVLIVLATVLTLPWTLARVGNDAASPRRFEATNPALALQSPSTDALLGTDRLGRDLGARLLLGGGISLLVGLCAAVVALTLGTAWGIAAGLAGGRADAILMRIVDVLYGLPSVLLVVVLAVALDGVRSRLGIESGAARMLLDLAALFIAIGAVGWLTLARVVRGQVLSLKVRPFLDSARVAGVSRGRLLRRYYLPWLAGPVLAYTALIVPTAMLAEAFLSFLGIGVREPLPSWGALAANGLSELNPVRFRWWLLVPPCALIGATLVALTVMGESLRARTDPRYADSRARH